MSLTGRQLGLLAALTLIWGANWPIMKFTLREVTPLWFRAVTMAGGTLVLSAYYLRSGVSMRLPREEAARVAWLALPNILGWHFFSIIGLAQLASGRAATLAFTMPIWTVLIGALLAGIPITRRAWASAVAGAAAVGLLAIQEIAHLAGRPVGVLWMQLAAICWATGTLAMRRTRTTLSNEAVTVWMMVIGSVAFLLVAPAAEPLPDPARFGIGTWLALAYGVVLNFGAAQVIWFGMARTLPPAASAFSIMAVPLIGTLSATWIVGETPRVTDWIAAACIVVAVASALLPPRRRENVPST